MKNTHEFSVQLDKAYELMQKLQRAMMQNVVDMQALRVAAVREDLREAGLEVERSKDARACGKE